MSYTNILLYWELPWIYKSTTAYFLNDRSIVMTPNFILGFDLNCILGNLSSTALYLNLKTPYGIGKGTRRLAVDIVVSNCC